MANIKSQKKRNRQNVTRYARNKAFRSELKTREKHVMDAAEAGDCLGELPRGAIELTADRQRGGEVLGVVAARHRQSENLIADLDGHAFRPELHLPDPESGVGLDVVQQRVVVRCTCTKIPPFFLVLI